MENLEHEEKLSPPMCVGFHAHHTRIVVLEGNVNNGRGCPQGGREVISEVVGLEEMVMHAKV